MGDDASQRSLDVQAGQLKEFVADLAARVAAIEALRDRVERRERIDEILATAGHPPPSPRHAAPKRDRSHLRVIPGGLAALVPLPGHGAAAFLPAFGQVWLGRRPWPRWAVAALALGLTGATEVPTAADVRAAPAVSAPAAACHASRWWRSDRDGKTVVARLPLTACPAAGEGNLGRLPPPTMGAHARGGIMGS